MAEALLISGTVGAGKTSVADALGDLLQEAGVAGAVVEDFTVDGGAGSVHHVAGAVRAAAGWKQ